MHGLKPCFRIRFGRGLTLRMCTPITPTSSSYVGLERNPTVSTVEEDNPTHNRYTDMVCRTTRGRDSR